MGANIYEMGFKGWIGTLFLPDINLKYGCEFINKMMKRHKLHFDHPLDIYAAFNSGSVRIIGGQYVNASAVRNFEKHYLGYQDTI